MLQLQSIRISQIEAKGMVAHVQEKWKTEFEKRKKLHNLVRLADDSLTG
jgi:kinesin family protein C2/C3